MEDLNTLKANLQLTFKKNLTNKELSKELTKEVLSKSLPVNLAGALFNKAMDIVDLKDNALICVTTVFHRFFKLEEFNPANYFSQQQLINYTNDIRNQEMNVDTLEFKNCIKINDTSYLAFCTAKELYDYYINNLIIYNKSTQRASRIRVLGNNYIVKEINVNKKSVKEITQEMLNNTYESDMIIFNVVQIDGKKLNVDFTNGNLLIKPNLDLEQQDTTIVNVIDGYHRLSAIVKAVEELKRKNKPIPNTMGLIVKIVIRDIAGAKRIVSQSFKRSATDKDFLKTLVDDDYNKLAQSFIDKSKCLKEKIYDTYEECVLQEGYTYKILLADTLRLLLEKNNGYLNNLSTINKMANHFDRINEYITNEYYTGVKDYQENSYLLRKNSFVFWLVYLYRTINIEEEKLITLADRIVMTSSEWGTYPLDKKKIPLKEMVLLAEKLVKEVLESV